MCARITWGPCWNADSTQWFWDRAKALRFWPVGGYADAAGPKTTWAARACSTPSKPWSAARYSFQFSLNATPSQLWQHWILIACQTQLMILTSLRGWYYYYLHFTDRKIEALRGKGICLSNWTQVCLIQPPQLLVSWTCFLLASPSHNTWPCLGSTVSLCSQERSLNLQSPAGHYAFDFPTLRVISCFPWGPPPNFFILLV